MENSPTTQMLKQTGGLQQSLGTGEDGLLLKILRAHTPGAPSDIPPLPPERQPDIVPPPDLVPVPPEELPPRVPPVPQQDPPANPHPLR